MKNIIFALLSLLISTTADAQKPRVEQFKDHKTETYAFKRGKGDSVQYVIQGQKDTVQTTTFFRSGKPSDIVWKDSSYEYNIMGWIFTKRFGLSKGEDNPDSTLNYYPNGRLKSMRIDKNDVFKRTSFQEDGKISLTYHLKKTPSVSWSKEWFGDGTLKQSRRADSILIDTEKYVQVYDTTFFTNGQPYSIVHKKGKGHYTNENILTKYFNKDGSLIESILADSLILSPFKDNVDCYYGLKNEKDDTIIKPKFDRVLVNKYENMIKTYIGDACTVYNLDGTAMKQPIKSLRNVAVMSKQNALQNFEYSSPNYNPSKNYMEDNAKQKNQKYLVYMDGDHQFGITDKNGDVVIKTQPLVLGGPYIGDGQYFPFVERLGDSVIRRGFLDRRGKQIFPTYFKYVSYGGYQDYFTMSKETSNFYGLYNPQILGSVQETLVGLGKASDETLVLPPNYDRISYLAAPSLYVATLPEKKDEKTGAQGIYNPRTKKWLLEAKESMITSGVGNGSNAFLYFVIKNMKTQKYSIMDTTGKYVVATSVGLDSVCIIDNKEGLFYVKKKGKYHILEIKNGRPNIHSTGYEYLDYLSFGENYNDKGERFICFLAKNKGKWGVIDLKENIIKPFEYDYTSEAYDRRTYESGFFLVKNNIATYHILHSLPNETPNLPNVSDDEETNKKAVYSYKITENTDCLFFINDTGKVMIPPQYKKVEKYNDSELEFQIVEDNQKHKKIIFSETGSIIDMPFRYDVRFADVKSRIMIVKDTTEVSYGVVSLSGKELIPPINYGVAIGDMAQSVFFVKRDTPEIQRFTDNNYYGYVSINTDSINLEDKDWMMFDGEGKQLVANSFRFPILFVDGIGVGLQGDDFNLYHTDGSIFLPFDKATKRTVERNFNNIRRVKSNNFYVLYRNQGLTPTMMLTKSDGEILIHGGRYDGISEFSGPYALVSTSGRIGLIDSFGREIIAPEDLRTSKAAFVDSMNLNKRFLYSFEDTRSDSFDTVKPQPFAFNSGEYDMKADSLKISAAQRLTLLNLMLEKSIPLAVSRANTLKIPRARLKKNVNFFQEEYAQAELNVSLRRLKTTDNTLSFSVVNPDTYTNDFYNFKKINDRWEERSLFDILDLNGDKRWALNELLTKKIKALKDETIDCSNSSAFLSQVERRFMLTEQGIDFCFESENQSSDLVVIAFNWLELGPFMRK